jgi:hypothetical protein
VIKWTQDDFDSMSWHDNHVHALRLIEGEHGAGDFELDLDYILEWLQPTSHLGSYRYRIAPARLRFHDVTDLAISIDYGAASAAMGPFSIAGIERRIEQRQHYLATCWRIPVNFPPGEIRFEASGFEQSLVADELLVDRQWLTPTERGVR